MLNVLPAGTSCGPAGPIPDIPPLLRVACTAAVVAAGDDTPVSVSGSDPSFRSTTNTAIGPVSSGGAGAAAATTEMLPELASDTGWSKPAAGSGSPDEQPATSADAASMTVAIRGFLTSAAPEGLECRASSRLVAHRTDMQCARGCPTARTPAPARRALQGSLRNPEECPPCPPSRTRR